MRTKTSIHHLLIVVNSVNRILIYYNHIEILIAIASVVVIAIGIGTQAYATVPTGCTGNPHGEFGINPETGNPHFPGETGNPHLAERDAPRCSGS